MKIQGTVTIEENEPQYRPNLRIYLKTVDHIYLINTQKLAQSEKEALIALNGTIIAVEGIESWQVFYADSFSPVSD